MTDTIQHVASNEIGQKARKGAIWSALEIGGRNVVSIGSTAVLSRILTPDDYGLMGMVATLTALLVVFSDMGLSWATIQRPNLTAPQVANLFWINSGVGLALWLSSAVASPLVAAFYERAELGAVTAVMGASFFLGGLAVQPFALLRRQMDFRRVALIELLALIASAIAAIAAALLGWSYWALVVQALTSQSVRLILVARHSRECFRRPERGVGTRSLVRFGGLLAINGLLIYLSRSLDNVLIGRYWGAEELGYYSRAYFLMLLPSTLATGLLANLMVSSLSALQSEPERFGLAYRRAVRLVAFVGCPLALGLALTASDAVGLVYGDQWMSVAPILVWLSVAGVTQPIYNTTGWLFTATGKAGVYLWLTGINAIVLTAAFLLAIDGRGLGIARTYGIVMGLLLLIPAMVLAHRAASIPLWETVKVLMPVVKCLIALAAAVLGVTALLAPFDLPAQVTLIIKMSLGASVYLMSARVWSRPVLADDITPMLPASIAARVAKWV